MDYPLWKKSRIQAGGKMIFLDIFEEDFSTDVLRKVVGLEVSFPSSYQMARSDQDNSCYAQNNKFVSVTAIKRHTTFNSGKFGNLRWAFHGPIA